MARRPDSIFFIKGDPGNYRYNFIERSWKGVLNSQ